MKKYPKIVQCDNRGQIVIPKDLRTELGIGEATGFLMYAITNEGILLKKIESSELDEHVEIITELEEKADKIRLKKENLEISRKNYKKTTEGSFELI